MYASKVFALYTEKNIGLFIWHLHSDLKEIRCDSMSTMPDKK